MSQIGGQDINASLFGNKIGSKTYQSTTEILEIDNFDREFLKTLRPTFATLWELIFPKIVAIFSGPADDIDNDEIYAIVDQLCKGGYQREFYQKLVEFIEKMVDQATNNFSINGSSLVEDIICFWQSFRSSINALGKLCVILDRSYIKRELSSSLVLAIQII
ncbi:hypothetical protein RF11_02698 [Thelohanellus kitauei]|uniref:Cullin N-terminal domain-containing protein n=1 Tax=Thelohanellus kitauei TaxID=669202 RepID=A0A0C2J832_THEKT|nr:hypothetical protein RF11_02698 [Thelohanellus kitauei]